jgi:alcohol dehydrogenase class IV
MLRRFPIPQRLREVGFDAGKVDFVADEIAAASIKAPQPATAEDVRQILRAAM